MPVSTGAQMTIVVDETDVDAALLKLGTVLTGESLATFLVEKASLYLQTRTSMRFGSEAAPGGAPWEPLHQATQDIRTSLGYQAEHPINQRSGDFRGWLTKSWGDAVPTGNGAELVWPSKGSEEQEHKLSVAQQGSPRGANPEFPSSTTNPRPVLGTDVADLTAVLVLLGEHINLALGGGSSELTGALE